MVIYIALSSCTGAQAETGNEGLQGSDGKLEEVGTLFVGTAI